MLDFKKRIFVGITCTSVKRKKDHWKNQLKEINKLKIKQITLFPTTLKPKERQVLYKELEASCVEEIKLVHLRGEDFTKKEILYLKKQFKTKLFNCHEEYLDILYKKFPEFRKNIVLELNYDDRIENHLQPNRLDGFCIDFAHMKAAKDYHDVEYDYIMQHIKDT